MKLRLPTFLLALIVLLSPATGARANGLSLIRDAEVENTIRTYADPILRAAGLSPEAVDIYLVNNDQLNAFVAGGQNIFIHTGLLLKAETAAQVIGVIAHEVGHITGGHLARHHQAMEDAAAGAMAAMLLGTAAAILSGRGDIGAAVAGAGQQGALRNYLTFSREQESAADQAATRFLAEAGYTSRGLLEFMRTLEGQEYMLPERQDLYVRTHPLTRDRIRDLEEAVSAEKGIDDIPDELQVKHDRMRAKLFAFLKPPIQVFARYTESDDGLVSRYARAVAWYRKPDLQRALALMDGLIADYPDDPYFHELKGQALFEHGRAGEALHSYREAVRLAPEEPLLRVGLAQAAIEIGGAELLEEAASHLEWALSRDPRDPSAWRLLALAQGRKGNMAEADYAMAEYNFLTGRPKEAARYAERAKTSLPSGTPRRLRAEDILHQARQTMEDEEARRRDR